MLVKDWMTAKVITASPTTSLMKAAKILKDNSIRRLPVVDEKGLLIGIVTDQDVKDASPSKATSLEMHELYYLLSEIKVKDIMAKKLYTVRPDDTVERAAVTMLEHRVGSLPVVDEAGGLAGIITDSDVFKVLVGITGVLQGGVQLALTLKNAPGELKEVQECLRDFGARIISILTSFEAGADDGERQVFIRVFDLPDNALAALVAALKEKFALKYFVRDNPS
jgi:acetoin utilization protein AcuB